MNKENLKIDLAGQIKSVVRTFISEAPALQDKPEVEQELLQHLNSNHYDERFFIESVVEYNFTHTHFMWCERMNQEHELWTKTVIEAAKHSNQPEEIANNVLKEYFKQFINDQE